MWIWRITFVFLMGMVMAGAGPVPPESPQNQTQNKPPLQTHTQVQQQVTKQDIITKFSNQIVLRKCNPPELTGEARQFCSVLELSEEEERVDTPAESEQQARALVCYAWFDLLLRWCDAKLPLEPLQHLLSSPAELGPSEPSDLCPLLQDALPATEYTQTGHFLRRLRATLKNERECTLTCYNYNNLKPVCSYFLEGNRLFTNLTTPTPTSNPPPPLVKKILPAEIAAKQINLGKVEKGISDGAPDYDVKNHPISHQDPSSKENYKPSPNLQVSSPKNKIQAPIIIDEGKNYISKQQTAIQNNIPSVVVKSDLNDPIGIEKPMATAEKPADGKQILNPEDKPYQMVAYDDDERDFDIPHKESSMKSSDEHDHAINDGSSLSHNVYAKVNQEGILETGELGANHNSGTYQLYGRFVDSEDSNLFMYLLLGIGLFILGYVLFHNKNRVLGLLIEGRRSSTTRRRGGGAAYRKLDCTLEEAVSSTPPSHGPNIVY